MGVSRQAESCSTFLDTLTPTAVSVGYGSLGVGGALGYERQRVAVGGRTYEHALSTHPPARLLYHVGGGARLRCEVALNDDIAHTDAYADFVVLADGREISRARDVAAGEVPRPVTAELGDARQLELVVTTKHWECCHAVWLDPRLEGPASDAGEGGGEFVALSDCLGYAEIGAPAPLPAAPRCVATVASAGFEAMLDDMLGSLAANGNCNDALLVVVIMGPSPACEDIAAKYRAVPIHCRPLRPISRGSKSVLYSVARFAHAERYLCLDADTIVLGELAPLFAAIDACPAGSTLACREGNVQQYENLDHVLWHAYGGATADVERILGEARGEESYPLVLNDGVFAGSRLALTQLDATLRAMPGATTWLDERPEISWRNQFLFNLALARNACGVELDPTYNVQLHTSEVEVRDVSVRPDVRWSGRPVRILHESATGRGKVPELRGLYGAVPDPLVGRGDGDAYDAFLSAVKAWLGRYGLSALRRSFYGTWEHDDSRVRDPSMLPVLGLLHYLVRASGAVRVLETGTMRGVSAACLASAVAHRPGGRVVTFDPFDQPGRIELWNTLPVPMRDAIEARSVDSIAGMSAALGAGERYDAALLDSLHDADHVWSEFELARRLVRPGGPILTHDWRWEEGVQAVLDRVADAGYGVVRLLGPGEVEEESGLGLALVENRLRASAQSSTSNATMSD